MTKAELLILLASLVPDNDTGQVSPANMREILEAIIAKLP